MSRPHVLDVYKSITTRLEAGMLKEIEEWRAKQRPLPSVAASIRMLIERGLKKVKS